MRIGIDARPLEGNLTGIGKYIWNLCCILEKFLPDSLFFLYTQSGTVNVTLPSNRWAIRSNWIRLPLMSSLWLKSSCASLVFADDLDIFWAGATFLPPLPRKTKKIVTVHDLTFMICPETMALQTLLANKLFFVSDVRKADVITTNSFGTASRLKDLLGIPADKVIHPGVDLDLFRPSRDISVLEKYGITGRYIITIGTLEPRKNLDKVIAAFDKLVSDPTYSDVSLVVAGGKGWKDESLLRTLENSSQIRRLGYVDEADLAALYTNAEAFVFPSIYEGFGMPVVEAAACNAKIIATDIPEIREAGGAAPTYIAEPSSVAIYNALVDVMGKPSPAFDLALPTWDQGGEMLASLMKTFTPLPQKYCQ